jgi:hypothetical protein
LGPQEVIAKMSGYSGSIPTTWIQEHPRLGVLLLIFYLLIAHRIFILFQRLFYSPLAKFPGPKLAAATSLYETYFNLVKNGKYYLEVERLHNIYGNTSSFLSETVLECFSHQS